MRPIIPAPRRRKGFRLFSPILLGATLPERLLASGGAVLAVALTAVISALATGRAADVGFLEHQRPLVAVEPVLPVQLGEALGLGIELAHAVEEGALARDDVTDLGAVLAGRADGRRTDDEITAFDSTGLAIQDLAIALAALKRADDLSLPTLDL